MFEPNKELDKEVGRGVEFYEKGEYEKAIAIFRMVSDKGYPRGWAWLAAAYREGKGVERDEQEAMRFEVLIQNAAKSGNPVAQNNLAIMYADGQGVEQDHTEAIKWYRKAAEQGDVRAQYNLGRSYADGQGVAQNYVEAVKWCRKAAEQDDTAAQYTLGSMYADGQGVEQDHTEAVKWYRKAASQGDAYAQYSLGIMYMNGCGVKENDAKAVKWYLKAANQGLVYAQYNLGIMYMNGCGVEEDKARAIHWYRKAADQGDADAQYMLGKSVDDDAKAIQWYRKAAEQGHAKAQYVLGNMYRFQDEAEAIQWYGKAADQGHSMAPYHLPSIYVYAADKKEDLKTRGFGFNLLQMRRAIKPEAPSVLLSSSSSRKLADVSQVLRVYRAFRENGASQDDPKVLFPSAGLDTLDLVAVEYVDKKKKWPDKQGRYWWELSCKDGRVINDFYWMKDEVRGYPDRNEKERYWFIVYHAPTGTKIEGFSQEPDRQKGFPDSDKDYWYYTRYIECGPIKQWMEEKDRNYLARLKLEKEQLKLDVSSSASSGASVDHIEADKSVLFKVRAEFDNDVVETDELTFKAGDILSVINADNSDWWMAYNLAEKKGLIPSNFVSKVVQNDVDESSKKESSKEKSKHSKRDRREPVSSNKKEKKERKKKTSDLELKKCESKKEITASSNDSILEAVAAKNQTLFKQLKENPNANWKELDESRNNIFHLAARHGNSKVFHTLLQSVPVDIQGGLLRQVNEKDETPLHLAARFGYTDVIGDILTVIAANLSRTLKVYDERGYLPLHEAAFSGELKLIQVLINAGADTNALTEDGLNIQQIAVQQGHTLLAQTLAMMMQSGPSSTSTVSLTSPQATAKPILMSALRDYQSQSQEELSVFSGETVFVLEDTEDGWGYCQNSRGQEGYLPLHFLSSRDSAPIRAPSNRGPLKIDSSEAKSPFGLPESSGSSGSSDSHSLSGDKKTGSFGSSSTALSASNLKASIDDSGVGVVDLLIPFSEITLGEELGKGGFGVVYRGERHGENVAVKKLTCQSMNEKEKKDFMNEASIMLRLQHGNIVRLYGISLEPYAMVMEFLEKGSLYSLLHSKESLSFIVRYKIALDIANGLSFLHSREMVHCDLKSLNVLLDERYKAKLADFGMSKIRTSTSSFAGAQSGTVHWSSPEYINGEKYAKPADVYSYGVILWEILARKLPYSSMNNRGAIMNFVILGKREPIPENSPEILARLTEECWAQEVKDRPTMQQVVSLLKESPVTDEGTAQPGTVDKIEAGAGYNINSGQPASGCALPAISGRGRGMSRGGSGVFAPIQSTEQGGAYGVDSGPGRGRAYGSPLARGRGGAVFSPAAPTSEGLDGGGYGVNSGPSRGRGMVQTPSSGSVAYGVQPAYALDSSPQRGSGFGDNRGRGRSGFFQPATNGEGAANVGFAYGIEAGAGYNMNSGQPASGRALPAISGRGRGMSRGGSGVFAPIQSTEQGGAYGVDSGPGRGRAYGSPLARGRGGAAFSPAAPTSEGMDGGGYGVNSGPSRGRGMVQTPSSGSVAYGVQPAYALDSSPQQVRGRGSPTVLARGRGRGGSGVFLPPAVPTEHEEQNDAYGIVSSPQRGRGFGGNRGRERSGFFQPATNGEGSPNVGFAYGLDSTKKSEKDYELAQRPDTNISRPGSGYGGGGYG